MGVLLVRHIHHLEQFTGDLIDPLFVISQAFGDHRDVFGHGHIREKSDLLDDIADLAPKQHGISLHDVPTLHEDAPLFGLNQSIDGL